MTITPDETIAILNLVELLVKEGVDVYGKLHELSVQAGITDEQLDAAEARFEKLYTDPLNAVPVPPPNPPPDPYFTTVFTSVDQAKAAGKVGDKVYVLPDETFRLVYGGAGSPISASWTLVAVIEG